MGRACSGHPGGIGLLLPRRFEPGTVLAIELPAVAGAAPRVLLARVRHATRHGAGWLLGCEFVWSPNDDELRAFLP